MFEFNNDTLLTELANQLKGFSKDADMQAAMIALAIQMYNVKTVGDVLKLDVSTTAYVHAFEALQAWLKNHLIARKFCVRDIKENFFLCTSAGGDDYGRIIFKYDLLSYERFDSQCLIRQRDGHKVLVISGESGIGKSCSAVLYFPNTIMFANSNSSASIEKIIVFYCCRDSSVPDLQRQGSTNAQRDAAALHQLNQWWRKGMDELLGAVARHYPQMQQDDWEHIGVVMVVDELGNRPELLRGLIASAADFEKQVTFGQTLVATEQQQNQLVGSFRLICVGTGLDWVVANQGDLASDAGKFHHVPLQRWSRKNLATYLESRLSERKNDGKVQEVIDAIQSLQISRLGTNARCASYLAEALLNRSDIWDSVSPRACIFQIRRELFTKVARAYRSANGIGVLFHRNKCAALELLLPALRYVYADSLSSFGAEQQDQVKQLLVLGVLSYSNDKVTLSPAMLMLLLSEFGDRDITVLDGQDFERLAALRELCHILMHEPTAKVEMITLLSPIPSTRANFALKKQRQRQKGNIQVQCSWDLPSSHFFVPSPSADAAEKKIYDVQRTFENTYYIIVNGPMAPAPDVVVLPPVGSGYPTRFIQAKKYVQAYNPSVPVLMEELGKFGLNMQSHPATKMVLSQLSQGLPPQCAFVLRSESRKLIETLRGMSANEQLANDPLPQDTTGQIISIPVSIEGSKHGAPTNINVERIEALWEGIIFDSDHKPEVVTVCTNYSWSEDTSFEHVYGNTRRSAWVGNIGLGDEVEECSIDGVDGQEEEDRQQEEAALLDTSLKALQH